MGPYRVMLQDGWTQDSRTLDAVTEVHIGSHGALLGEVAGLIDTRQQNSGHLSATEVHVGSHWSLLEKLAGAVWIDK